MNDFFIRNYALLTHSFEFLAGITGLIFYKKYKLTYAKYFIWFLIFIAICDLAGTYSHNVDDNGVLSFLKGSKIEKNFWWYTLFWDVGGILFLAFYYSRILKKAIFKRIVRYLGYAFCVFSTIYLIINWDKLFNQFFAVFDVLGAIIVLTCSVFYFTEMLLSDRILTFYKSFNFYISVAIFIWWMIITPIVFYDNYLDYDVGSSNRDWNFIFLRWQIYLFANIFMYSTFTFALIFCKPENDSIETVK